MCQNHAELIQKSRHRYERPLFTLAATLTLGVWLILFALSFAKADTVAFLQQNIIAESAPTTRKQPNLTTLPYCKKSPRTTANCSTWWTD